MLYEVITPEIDGKETFTQLQKITSSPVIVVSALSGKETIIELLNLGCDDYISKPFDREELIARINAVLRRSKLLSVIDGVSIPEIGLMVNFSRREVHFQNQLINFSPKEYELVELFIKNIPHIVNYNEISEVLWGENNEDSKNRIKYLVHAISYNFV